MNEPIPDKNHPVEQDANRMFNHVVDAFHLPWPRKPLSPKTKAMGRVRVRSKTTTKHHTKSKGMKRSHNMDTLSGMWD